MFPQLAVNVVRRGEGDDCSVTVDTVTGETIVFVAGCGDGDVVALSCVMETALLVAEDTEPVAPPLMYRFTKTG